MGTTYVRTAAALAALGWMAVARAEEAPPPPSDRIEEPVVPAAEPAGCREWIQGTLGVPVHGQFSNKYRGRAAHSRDGGKATDEDFIQVLRLTAGEDAPGRWIFEFTGRASEDLDGNLHSTGYFPFDELSNSFSDRVNARFYTAALTGRNVGGLDRIRLGRQEIVGAEILNFDGVRLDGPAIESLARLQVTVFGGVPTHLYESPASGDWLAGTEVGLEPHRTARVTARYAHIVDEFSLYGTNRTDVESLSWRQQVWRGLSTETRFSFVDSRGREAAFFATWRDAAADLFAQAGYRRLMEQQGTYALDVDPFDGLLTRQVPYHQFEARAAKGVTSWLSLQGDTTVRTLKSESDEGEFNREFARFAVAPTATGWPDAATQWTLSATAWESEGTHLATYAGEVAQPVVEDLLLRAGTDYALFKFDLFSDRERTHARTYYAKLKWRQTKQTRWELGYERERNDADTFDKVEITVRYEF